MYVIKEEAQVDHSGSGRAKAAAVVVVVAVYVSLDDCEITVNEYAAICTPT